MFCGEKNYLIIKIKEGDNLMAHVNEVNALANQLTIVNKLVDDYNIIMTLLLSLLNPIIILLWH